MKIRSANQSLKGYYYQFNKTILSLLSSNATVTVEGIEDIDIENMDGTTLLQCKYYASSKYSLASLRPAIILMIKNFLNSRRDLNYIIYAHFLDLDSKVFKPSMDEIKLLFNYIEGGKKVDYLSENKITDDDLADFLSNFTISIGISFEQQQKQILELLGKKFKENGKEGQEYFYSKALKIVNDLAIQKEIKNRKITTRHFTEVLSNGKVSLFDYWFYQYKSSQQYINFIKNVISASGAKKTQMKKYIFIDSEIINTQSPRFKIQHFLKNLIEKHYKLGRTLSDAECWTVILEVTEEQMKNIKSLVIKDGLMFNDGCEHISFSPNFFNMKPVLQISQSERILRSSFSIRLISQKTFLSNLKYIDKPNCVFDFTKSGVGNKYLDIQYFSILVQKLEEISKIIN